MKTKLLKNFVFTAVIDQDGEISVKDRNTGYELILRRSEVSEFVRQLVDVSLVAERRHYEITST